MGDPSVSFLNSNNAHRDFWIWNFYFSAWCCHSVPKSAKKVQKIREIAFHKTNLQKSRIWPDSNALFAASKGLKSTFLEFFRNNTRRGDHQWSDEKNRKNVDFSLWVTIVQPLKTPIWKCTFFSNFRALWWWSEEKEEGIFKFNLAIFLWRRHQLHCVEN